MKYDLRCSIMFSFFILCYLFSAISHAGGEVYKPDAKRSKEIKEIIVRELDIKCEDRMYSALLDQLFDRYITVGAHWEVVQADGRKLRAEARAEAKRKGITDEKEIYDLVDKYLETEELENVPPIEFEAPEDLNYQVFMKKANAALASHKKYYETTKKTKGTQIVMTYRTFKNMENIMKAANSQCQKIDEKRKQAAKRGSGEIHSVAGRNRITVSNDSH